MAGKSKEIPPGSERRGRKEKNTNGMRTEGLARVGGTPVVGRGSVLFTWLWCGVWVNSAIPRFTNPRHGRPVDETKITSNFTAGFSALPPSHHHSQSLSFITFFIMVKNTRVTYRRRHCYNTKSNKIRKVKTPGTLPHQFLLVPFIPRLPCNCKTT